MLPDCGHGLSLRAATIEDLARTLCDIDRGNWSSPSHYTTTPKARAKLARELVLQIAGVPPEHCPSCGCPLSQHTTPRRSLLMGSGR